VWFNDQQPKSRALAHALLIDAREDGALDILMAQIALDCLTQKV